MKNKQIYTAGTAGGLGLIIGGVAMYYGMPDPEPVVETKTVVEEVEVTPAECLALVDSADVAVMHLLDALDVSADAMNAAGSMDLAALTAANDGLTQLLNETESIAAQYAADSVACESKGTR